MPRIPHVPVPYVYESERRPQNLPMAAGLAAAGAEPQDFVAIMRKIWRHRRVVLGCTLLLGGAAVVTAKLLPSHYVAETRVLVGVQEPRILSTDPQNPPDLNQENERVQSESFIVQSRELAKQVIDQLHLADNPEFNPALAPKGIDLDPVDYLPAPVQNWWTRLRPPPPAASAADQAAAQQDRMVDLFLAKIDVATLGRSQVLSIQADTHDPKLSAAIANQLAADYLQETRSSKVASSTQIQKYLTDRIGELRQQVEKAEEAAEDYRRENGLYKTGTSTINSQQLGEINTQLILAETAKAEADANLREAVAMKGKSVDSDSAPSVLRSPLIQALKEQQAGAERNLAELRASYGDHHPKVINAQAEIADLRHKIQVEIGHTIEGLRHEATTAAARYDALKRDLEGSKTQMGGANQKTIHLEALEREATVDRTLLETMLTRAKEEMGREDVTLPDARLISRAAPPQAPTYPPRGLIALLGAAAGLMIGLVIALIREGADQTFRRRDQIESLTGLPVMAMVPQIRRGTPPTLHVLRHPVSPFSEALRKIYVGLELADATQATRTVLFGSATPAEGKSVMVASLGRMLASSGKRIMLIDCDWRRPTLHQQFRCANKGGLEALLTKTGEGDVYLGDIVHNDPLSGVDLIVAGNWNPRDVHLMTSERMRAAMRTFAKNYDLVILDCAPVLVGAESLALAGMVDKTVFTVRWGHTKRDAVTEALKQLIDARADIAGIVFSRVDAKRYGQYSYGRMDYEYARPALTST